MNDLKQQLLDNIITIITKIEEENDLFDILNSALDIEYTIDGRGQYIGAKITVATGGPHIEINTRYNKVIGYWGITKIERSYDDNIGLYDYMEEAIPATQ